MSMTSRLILEFLSSFVKLPVDHADLFNDFFELVIVGNIFLYLYYIFKRDIIMLGFSLGEVDRHGMFGAMTCACSAFASRLSALFITLDDRASEDLSIESNQLIN